MRVVAVLADDEFVGHAAGGREAPVEGEIARAAQGVDQAGSAGEDGLAAVDDVAEAIVAAPGDAAVDGVLAVDDLIDLDGLVVLAFGGLGAEGVAGGIESVAGGVGEVVGQRLVLDFRQDGGVEAEALRDRSARRCRCRCSGRAGDCRRRPRRRRRMPAGWLRPPLT